MKTFAGSLVLALVSFWAAEAEAPLRIVTLGDSITKGVRPGVAAEQTFASILEKTLRQNFINATVTNAGIGGDTTEALKKLHSSLLEKQPDLVTIMYGTNDGYVDPGKSESRMSVERYASNLREIVTRLQTAGIQVVLMTEPMFGEDHRPNGVGEHPNVRLAKYVAACRQIARETATPLVDHFGHWAAVQKRGVKLQTWTTDGCHPNAAGHAEMAHRIVQTVLPLAQRFAEKENAWIEDAPFTVQLDTLTRGYDGKMCWVHPRASALPGAPPSVVLTMQRLLLTGSDVFYALNDMRTDDLGKTWSAIREHADTLGRRDEPDGIIVGACDFWPKFHRKSGKLLGIGHTVRYRNNAVIANRRRETCWSVYDDKARTWSAWKTLAMPDDPKFFNNGAGCSQRVDLENGDILLPIYFKAEADKYYRTTVLRCAFDGSELKFIEHGSDVVVQEGRGAYEPSLTRHRDRFFLTIRSDERGYVTASSDGLHFAPPQPWQWDDGAELGSYNTQTHWVPHTDALYLAYTRRGANNDHIIRHRAPLFIGRVDPQTLQVMRGTERILVPERGARLGNFGVTEVNENETWVTVAEWMQTFSPPLIVPVDNPYGADNSVFAARIRWGTGSEK